MKQSSRTSYVRKHMRNKIFKKITKLFEKKIIRIRDKKEENFLKRKLQIVISFFEKFQRYMSLKL